MKPRLAIGAHVPIPLIKVVDDRTIHGHHSRMNHRNARRRFSQHQGVGRVTVGALLLALLPAQSRASIGVILARRDVGVLAAADSRRTRNGVTDNKACKIRMGTLSIFVAGGQYPGRTLLDEVWAAGDRLASEHGTTSEHLRAIKRLLSNKRFTPRNREWRGAFAFVEMTPTGPFVAGTKFRIANGEVSFEDEIRDWRGSNFGAGYFVVFNDRLAETDEAITASLIKRSTLPDLIALATRIIDEQAKTDDSVHRPIDFALIDQAGPHWLQCKAECGEGCPR